MSPTDQTSYVHSWSLTYKDIFTSRAMILGVGSTGSKRGRFQCFMIGILARNMMTELALFTALKQKVGVSSGDKT